MQRYLKFWWFTRGLHSTHQTIKLAVIYYSESTWSRISKGTTCRHMVKSQGSQVQASKSPLPLELEHSSFLGHRLWHHTRSAVLFWAWQSRIFIRGQCLACTKILDPSKEKQVFSINHIIFINTLYSVSTPIREWWGLSQNPSLMPVKDQTVSRYFKI